MDGATVSRIERWTRNLLEAEAKKRGVRDAELRSRAELLRAIVQHDYGTRQSLRNARKLVSTLIDTASAARGMFGKSHAPPPPRAIQAPPAPTPLAAAAPQIQRAPEPAAAPPPAPQPSAVAQSPSRIALKRDHAELELTWQVNDADAQRARALLGHPGELALRVVTVRPDPDKIVQSEITEHGPLNASGAWTLLLPTPDANCVGAIGVRHGERFVSIAHESSRVSAS